MKFLMPFLAIVLTLNIYIYGPGFTGVIPSRIQNISFIYRTQYEARLVYARLFYTYSRR